MVFKSAKVLIATIGLCLGSAAIAEDLVAYSSTDSGTYHYYYADTIIRYPDNTVEVWTKADHSKDKTVSWRTSKDKLRINCYNETYGLKASYEYGADGSIMNSQVFDYPNMRPIVPESVMNILRQKLCSK
jgi:hypothetical protein